MKKKFPGHHRLRRAHRVGRHEGRRELQTRSPSTPTSRASTCRPAASTWRRPCRCSRPRACSCRRSDPKHIFVVSNDGIPQEFEAIRKGEIDATVSQPADLYAKYALFYAKAALDGKTFQPGPTDHDSTIVQLPNGLEDQLARPAGHQGQRRRPGALGQPGQVMTAIRYTGGRGAWHHQALRPHHRARRCRDRHRRRARPTRWSAATAPASPRWCRSSPACSGPTPARSASAASPRRRWPTGTPGGSASPASTRSRRSSPR